MARPLRINLAGAWYHVMSRGNGGDSIFRSDVDRHRFLGWLAEMPERFSLEVHAFVVMDNHYPLLWEAMVEAAEKIQGRRWAEMMERHGDWGRNGLLTVTTRHLGWRLVEVVQRLPGLGYSAAAQGIRRFWQLTPHRLKMQAFENALVAKLSIVQV